VARRLRKICADKIIAEPELYNEATLDGKSTTEYALWISDPHNWGGEIELSILAAHYQVELCIVSMEAFYILPFALGTKGRCYLLYTGQHYDPLVGVASEDAPVDDEIKLFADKVGDGASLDPLALDCARIHAVLAAQKASRRTVTKIRCGGCGVMCDDSAAFQEHCGEVEHGEDFCYDCTTEEVTEEGGDAVPSDRIDLDSPQVVTFYHTPTAPFSSLHNAAPFVGESAVAFPSVEHFVFCAQFGPKKGPATGGADDGSGAAAAAAEEAVMAAILACPVKDLRMLEATLNEVAGWDKAQHFECLKQGFALKFAQHADLRGELQATAGKTLVLVDADTWWGMSAAGGIPTGRNRAGQCLMEVRDGSK